MRLDCKKIVFFVVVICIFVALIIGYGYRKDKNNQNENEIKIENTDDTSKPFETNASIEPTKNNLEEVASATTTVTETIEATTETTKTTDAAESENAVETTNFTEEIPTEQEEVTSEPTEETTTSNENEYRYLINLGEFRLTAYCSCKICCGDFALNRPVDENGKEIVYGSIGVRLEEGISIAVDPNVIEYGSKVVIGDHTYIAQDTGGAIKGNRIDIYFEDHQRASNFGTQYKEVYLVQE